MTRLAERRPAWVTPGVPCFAVVGKVNMGKSAVLATLLEEDDDRVIRISPEPGETTRCQRLSLVLDGAERLRFVDTPGFQQPIEALRAIRAAHGDPATTPGLAALERFVARSRAVDEFADECRLLEPLLEGAGVVYVIDPGVPVYDSFLAEIEILRFSGRARLAVLNTRGAAGRAHDDYEADWRAHLNKAFNLVRGFDAHQARFAARRELLAALNQIDERDRGHLETTVALLESEWAQRRERAAEHILAFIAAALALREQARYRDDARAPDSAKRNAVAGAGRRYFERITALERETADVMLAVYRHKAVRAGPRKTFGDDLDLASDETWRRLGLTRGQLTVVGAGLGAGAGLGLDVATLGHSLGLGAVVGGFGGGALAFFKGEALPTLKLDIGPPGLIDGRQVTLGPPRNPNFAWVLLDSALLRFRQVLARAHARRGDDVLAAMPASRSGIARLMPAARRRVLARWFRDLNRNRADDASRAAAADAVIETLAAVEAEL